MNIIKNLLFTTFLALFTLTMYSCKTKKLVAKPTPAPVEKPAPPVEEKKPAPAPEKEEAPAPAEKPNFNLDNIQFEFNSFVLKTSSFSILDKAVTEMKKSPNTKFILNGHSSAEGTPEHNMQLSVDRANAVKSYFINAGLNGNNFTVVGHGEKEPISSNASEEGRILNRRTEIKVQN
ncbi:OmpA family protein [Pedobacter riviphilus]|uniref:OmpA family protein n=1 Tax=Pedobacter riviphilus TaxID=2766984 RepID=A0ABX6TMC2_9SPHI|nr:MULTISPECIES: OmpA family protein [Pedobacter]NII82266.1 OOP family OmpA-OmpF porin [Pedobacter sp. SG908]NMN36290.1 OOP family OmpA-OmpF porin [Pedobacter sp. SG918]QNR86051.1 OmpA family protein [Pedobacter riviphilus]